MREGSVKDNDILCSAEAPFGVEMGGEVPGGPAPGADAHHPDRDNWTIALPISFSATSQFRRALASSVP